MLLIFGPRERAAPIHGQDGQLVRQSRGAARDPHPGVRRGATPVGTGRLLRDGRIGRMAVLKEWRGKGAGSALMDHLIGLARKMGFDEVRLHAQTHAAGFYAKHGFTAEGEEFMEAGIPHVAMSRTTADTNGTADERR
ncbi:MAG: GNAT family N-acetyltransferase [Betaproteobacteria bacterium]|nr:GNAT family N-acetyltransferase [Betaproteobacteria bacterium]